MFAFYFLKFCSYVFKKDFICLFLEREEEGEKERERNINVWEKYQSVASRTRPSQGPGHNPDMCPDQE